MELPLHPTINALLNFTAALLLASGRLAIAADKREVHKKFMGAAFATSLLFLLSYFIYHYTQVATVFAGEGPVRTFYYGLLISHILLAVAIIPMVVLTLRRGLKSDFNRHKAIARWTLPLWMYVSVTGVLVYLMLYVFYPASKPLEL